MYERRGSGMYAIVRRSPNHVLRLICCAEDVHGCLALINKNSYPLLIGHTLVFYVFLPVFLSKWLHLHLIAVLDFHNDNHRDSCVRKFLQICTPV